MNIPYLVQVLKTNKLSELVAHMDAPPIDVNIAIWDAIDSGQIEIDEKKDRVKVLIEAVVALPNKELPGKILRAVSQYASNESNMTRGRLTSYMKDPVTGVGYPMHDYLMTLQYLIDKGEIIEYEISVPELKKKRPYHKFVFLCLPGNPNEEWNSKAVNKWIAQWGKKK